MRETSEDLRALQELLDRSYDAAGPHLRATIEPHRRLTAAQLVERFDGMRYVVVATVSADGRPFTAPADAFLIRGELWFGSSLESVRIRHLRARPACSATLLDGLELLVTMHGTARFEDRRAHRDADEVLRAQYPDLDDFAPGEYIVLRPEKLFAATFA